VIARLVEMILGPLQYPFMVRGLIAATLVGATCAVMGSYVVLRGLAFLGDALAHAILPGVALGYLVSGGDRAAVFVWALATAILTSIGIGAISERSKLREDTAVGILFAGMFALGIALMSTMRNYAVDITHLLFGDVLGVSAADLWFTAAVSAVVIILVLATYKELLILTFDPLLAATLRLPTRALHYLLLVLIALAVVVSLRTVGIALMVAMLVTPAATASLLTRRFGRMMAISALLGALSGVIGLYASFYVRVASGAAVVLTCTAFFVLALLIAPERGLLWRHRRAMPGEANQGQGTTL